MDKGNDEPEGETNSRKTYYDDAQSVDRRSVIYEELDHDHQPNEQELRYETVQKRLDQPFEITRGKALIAGCVLLFVLISQIVTTSLVVYLMRSCALEPQTQVQRLNEKQLANSVKPVINLPRQTVETRIKEVKVRLVKGEAVIPSAIQVVWQVPDEFEVVDGFVIQYRQILNMGDRNNQRHGDMQYRALPYRPLNYTIHGLHSNAYYKICVMASSSDLVSPCSLPLTIQSGASGLTGNWTDWSNWDSCTMTCGVGLQRRNRTCDSPSSRDEGCGCPGDSTDYQVCTEKECSDPIEKIRKDIEESVTAQLNSSQQELVSIKDMVGKTNERLDDLLRMPFNSTGQELLVVKGHLKPNIAFLARDLFTSTPGRNRKLVFVSTVVNTDDVYSVTSGEFTAPIEGTYWFSVQICGEYNSYVSFRIWVNDYVYSDSSNRNTDYGICTSSNTVAILKKGDKVFSATGENTNIEGRPISRASNRYNMFMGALVN